MDKPLFFETLVNTIPSPIFYKDINGIYLGCNTAYENFFGITQEKLTGKSVYDISPKELADIYAKQDQALFNNPGKQEYESLVKDTYGVIHNVIFNKATFTDTNGKIQGLVGIILDITDLKKAQDVIKEKIENLEKLNKLMLDREIKMIELKTRIEQLEQEKLKIQ